MLWKPAAHMAGGQRLQRKEGRPRNHPTHSSCACKHREFSLENFHQGLFWLRLLKSLLCTPAAGNLLCRKLLCLSRRQKSNRIVFLWKNTPIFSCQWNSLKMSSMFLSSCLQLCFLNWTFQIIWMPAQIIWHGLGCWQVGCYFGNFQWGKKKKKKKNQSTKHKTAKQITHWLVSHMPLRLLIKLYPWLSACCSTDGRTGC